MNPKTVDWKMFLGTEFGLAPDQPFNRAKYAQWRCYWDFGGGMYTDLFVHQLTHLIQAMGVRFPRRVVGAGGLYLEYDGRDVPDVATVVADYDEGCQVIISATMCNDVQLGEVIRGHTGTIRFDGSEDGFRVVPQKLEGRPPLRAPSRRRGRRARSSPPQPRRRTPAPSGTTSSSASARGTPRPSARPRPATPRSPRSTWASQSYRDGKAYFFDKETGKVSDADDVLGQEVGGAQPSSAASPTRSWAGRPATEGSLARAAATTRSSKATGSTARTPPAPSAAAAVPSSRVNGQPHPSATADRGAFSFRIRYTFVQPNGFSALFAERNSLTTLCLRRPASRGEFRPAHARGGGRHKSLVLRVVRIGPAAQPPEPFTEPKRPV